MKYTSSVSASGAYVHPPPPLGQPAGTVAFVSWQPSTWPDLSNADSKEVISVLQQIVDETMIDEIKNVISDAHTVNGDLQHRGHVVALALMCALDAVAAYGYRGGHGPQIKSFVGNHFPNEYKAHGQEIYDLYRCALVHEWNLFQVAIWPGNQQFTSTNGVLSVGLLTLLVALQSGIDDFFDQLTSNVHVRDNTLRYYNKLRSTAKS